MDDLISLHWLDWVVIGIYGFVTFAIAGWAMLKVKNSGDLLVGGRKMSKLMMVAASFAGGTNANHPMSVAAATYKNGLPGVWLTLTWMLITPFFWMYPPVLRRLRIVTLADVVEMRFGRIMDVIFKLVMIFTTVLAMGLGIKSAAVLIQIMTGGAVSGIWAQAFIAVPTLIYALMGGVIAAYMTDVFQGLLIIVLSFLMIPFGIYHAGGLEALDAKISNEMTQLFAGSGSSYGAWWIIWFAIAITFASVIASAGGAAAAKDENAARFGIFGLVLKRFCTVGWAMAGIIAFGLYAGHEVLDVNSGIEGAGPNNVFAYSAGKLLPVVLRGLMAASIIAAVMSSLDAMILGASGILVNNFYQRHFVKEASSSHYLLMTRIFACIALVVGWFAATQVTDLEDFSKFVEPVTSLTGIAILVALVWRGVTRTGALASVAVMMPIFLYFLIAEFPDGASSMPPVLAWLTSALHSVYSLTGADVPLFGKGSVKLDVPYYIPLYVAPGILTLVVVSLLTKQHDEHKVKEFYARLDTPVGQEHKLLAAGYQVDNLAALGASSDELDGKKVNDEKPLTPKRAQRLILIDLLRLPKLLRSGEAKISDYTVDLVGLAVSCVFVVAFLFGLNELIKWMF